MDDGNFWNGLTVLLRNCLNRVFNGKCFPYTNLSVSPFYSVSSLNLVSGVLYESARESILEEILPPSAVT